MWLRIPGKQVSEAFFLLLVKLDAYGIMWPGKAWLKTAEFDFGVLNRF
jgi:hypothetical protein